MLPEASSKTRSAASYNRRRAGNACLVCRARKSRCDNQRPVCGFCAATGGECRYADTDPARFDRASLAILQRLSELESKLVSHIDESLKELRVNSSADSSGQADLLQGFPNQPSATSSEPYSSNLYNHATNVNSENGNELHEDAPPSSKAILQASSMFADSILKWPIFTQAAPRLEQELQTPIMEIFAQANITPQTSSKGASMMNLESEWINRLVENFLTHNHVKNPILDVDLLRSYARDFAETGPQWDEKSCLMLLVCAVSCVSAPLDQEVEPGISKDRAQLDMAEAYFQASQRRIGILLHQNSLLVAQCSFLTGVYLMATLRILAAWKSFVQAGTQCLAWLTTQGRMKGIDNMVHPNANATTNYAEESLYWSCLKSELELRFELGLPGSGINEIKYPHVFPSPPTNIGYGDNYQQSQESPNVQWSTPASLASNTDRQNLELGWFFYLAEIALKRIVHNVVSWLYKYSALGGGKDRIEQYLEAGAAEYEIQIQEWYKALPPLMHFPIDHDQTTGDILRFILRGHMLDIREVVRFPSIHAALSSPSLFVIADYSPTSLRLLRELLSNASERIKANREGWFHRHQGTWLMARSASRSALHLMGMALKCQEAAAILDLSCDELEAEVLPTDWREAVELVVALLDYWGEESFDLRRLANILKELMRSYDNQQIQS